MPDFLPNNGQHFLDLGLAGGSGKDVVLAYLVDPGEQSVYPVESDGGYLLGLIENTVFLDQNAALGSQIQCICQNIRQLN